MYPRTEFTVVVTAILVALGCLTASQAQEGGLDTGVTPQYQALVEQYCTFCHNSRVNIGGHAFDQVDLGNIHQHADILEKAAVKIRSGSPLAPANSKSISNPSERPIQFRCMVFTESGQPSNKSSSFSNSSA